MSIEWRRVTSEGELDELADDWQALWAADPQAGLFTSWHWQRLWWQHYGVPGTLHVLVFSEGGDTIGIVALQRVTTRLYRGFPVRTLRWLGTGGDTSPEDLDILCRPEHRDVLVHRTVDYLQGVPGVQRLLLSDIPRGSALLVALQAAGNGWPGAHARAVPDTPLRFTVLPDSWSGYRELISRNTHKQIKRRNNRLVKAGSVEFSLCRSEAELHAASQALITLHRARQASKGEAGGFRGARYLGFHLALMAALLTRDELWLATLRLDGRIIAVEYAFCVRSTLSFFQTGFDPEHERLSPGHVLMTWMIEQAIESGVTRLELLRGDYPYKASYASQVRYSGTCDIMRPGWRAWLRRAVDRWRAAPRQ